MASATSSVRSNQSAPAVRHAELANAIRALAMDAVEKANSGHPGMPMGMADVATVLFTKFLKFDPQAPDWPDRDRFVLSAGHGSMLLYAVLYLTGYPGMTMAEIERFRQLNSATPGHPEYGHTPGVETTTGPLGQGFATSVGMALGERLMAARFGAELVDHYTYVIASDGDLMEGISHEAASLAGHLRLNKLIVLYDDNQISIDGPTSLALSDDAVLRFKAYGWNASAIDGHDPAAIAKAIEAAQQSDKPSLIACRTIIAYGAPTKAGTAASHGAPLGKDEIGGAREKLGWAHAPFQVPQDLLAAWRAAGARGAEPRKAWEARLKRSAHRAEFERVVAGRLPENWTKAIAAAKQKFVADKKAIATRQASGEVLEFLTGIIPELLGGSADLTGSVNTKPKNFAAVKADDFSARYVYYGVREHAMGAAMNGLALHKAAVPYGGTFLIFMDYLKPALRLSALMQQRVVYVFTHDSIGLGEDGPTHQPIEQLATLRATPNVLVFRPADAIETAECWQLALENAHGPSALALTRQGVPLVRGETAGENLSAKGAYVLAPADGAKVTLLATGSEVSVALGARDILARNGIAASVVSMPCWRLFERQDASYKESVIPRGTLKVAIEAAAQLGWDRYIGDGIFIGMQGFGASAPIGDLYKHFGITADAVAQAVTARLER